MFQYPCKCHNIYPHDIIDPLQNNNMTLEWKHVEHLYEVTVASAAKSVGLKLAHKFGREHVYLTSHSRMRVDLAAQVCTHAYIICTHIHSDDLVCML